MEQKEWRIFGMKVYHGTNQDIDKIDLSKGNKFKDFGQGFYVTTNIETAQRMATKKQKIFGGQIVIIEYEFDDTALYSKELKTLLFPEQATADWIKFIARNRDRHSHDKTSEYDIIKGPIADDGVAVQLERLKSNTEKAESIALDLQDRFLDQQILFGSTRSLNYLKKISVWKQD